jgi:hypothetical protein
MASVVEHRPVTRNSRTLSSNAVDSRQVNAVAKLKRVLGEKWTVRLRCLLRGYRLPRWGNLRTTEPFSRNFGFERGTPVDRYYLMKFLDRHRNLISGRVLEIQVSGYTKLYGNGVTEAHTVDIDPSFKSTYVCDLAESDGVIPSNYYDCFLLPNTLCLLRDIENCLRQALRVVKSGGVVLATTAGLLPLIADADDYWHLSAAGWRQVVKRSWPGCDVSVESHGNCLSATAAMLGLALEELRPDELDVQDPRYPVLVTLVCRKPNSHRM